MLHPSRNYNQDGNDVSYLHARFSLCALQHHVIFPNCLASASQYAAANSLLVHCIQREEGRPVFVDLTSYKTLLFTQVMQYKASVVNESKTSLLHLV